MESVKWTINVKFFFTDHMAIGQCGIRDKDGIQIDVLKNGKTKITFYPQQQGERGQEFIKIDHLPSHNTLVR